MKELGIAMAFIVVLVILIFIEVAVLRALEGLTVEHASSAYEPNSPIYKYIPQADPSWIAKFGDNERTRLIHTISELRVVVAAQGRRLLALQDPNEVEVDPNEVVE